MSFTFRVASFESSGYRAASPEVGFESRNRTSDLTASRFVTGPGFRQKRNLIIIFGSRMGRIVSEMVDRCQQKLWRGNGVTHPGQEKRLGEAHTPCSSLAIVLKSKPSSKRVCYGAMCIRGRHFVVPRHEESQSRVFSACDGVPQPSHQRRRRILLLATDN